MSNQLGSENSIPPVFVDDAKQGCELNLSADGKWMRLVVDGKLVASFHVNYVSKVLGSDSKKSISERSEKRPEPTANL
jgi:hypothetical protein